MVVDDSAASPRLIVLSATGTDFAVAAAAPDSATIRAGQSARFTINLSAQGGPLGDGVTFACSGLPEGAACSFNPAMIAAGAETATTTLTITTNVKAGVVLLPIQGTRMREWLAIASLVLTLLALTAMARIPQRRPRIALLRLAMLCSVTYLASCGGGGGGSGAAHLQRTPPGTYQVNVTASSGGASRTTPVSVTVK